MAITTVFFFVSTGQQQMQGNAQKRQIIQDQNPQYLEDPAWIIVVLCACCMTGALLMTVVVWWWCCCGGCGACE